VTGKCPYAARVGESAWAFRAATNRGEQSMHVHYRDILDRIDERPKWFDDVSVPRFIEFSPDRLANIYSKEAALAEVSCENCGHVFHVALSDSFGDKWTSLSDSIRLGWVRYGDPPNIQCCDEGLSMGTVMRRILEYWRRDGFGWRRDSTFEGPVRPEPASNGTMLRSD
jgi:hypothetical protein